MIINLYRYRAYIFYNAWAALRHRYAGTGMGLAWNLIEPLSMIFIYAIVFTNILKVELQQLPLGEYSFAMYLCAGFLPWTAFQECVTRGTNSFLANAVYLKKLAIPEQVFVAADALSATIGLCISFGLLCAIALGLGLKATLLWLLLPIPLLLFQAFGFGLGLFLGVFNVFFRDIGQLLGVVFHIWLWSSAVIYPETILPESARALLPFNPAFPFLEAAKHLFLFNQLPPAWMWAAMLFWSVGASIAGYVALRRLRPEIRDLI